MALDTLPNWLRDLIEYNDELAGRENGRRQRFFLSEEGDGRRAGDKKKEQRRFDELLRLLQNPVYAKLYYQAAETIERVDTAADRARRRLAQEYDAVTEQLDKLKSRAAEFPDGKKVFRARDGRLIAENGEDVTDRQESMKGLSPETSGWEEFRAAQDRLDEIRQQQREIDEYMQDVVEPFRQRMTDPGQPVTEEELREFHGNMKDGMPQALRAEYDNLLKAGPESKTGPVRSTAAAEYAGPTGLDAPDLFGQFKAAGAAIADDVFAPPAPDATADSQIAQTREPYGSQATSSPARTPKT